MNLPYRAWGASGAHRWPWRGPATSLEGAHRARLFLPYPSHSETTPSLITALNLLSQSISIYSTEEGAIMCFIKFK